MNIQYVKLDQITPYHNNPRKNKAAIKYVRKSLLKFGWRQPIVVDTEMVIVVGHTRYYAAKELGWDTAPVHIAEDLSTEQIKAYRLADNKTAEYSQWDSEKLLEEFEDLKMDDMFDMSEFGFTELSSIDDFFRNEQIPAKPRSSTNLQAGELCEDDGFEEEEEEAEEITSYSTKKADDAHQIAAAPEITAPMDKHSSGIICPFCGKEIPT